MRFFDRLFHHRFFVRLFHWEYWPFIAVYACILPWWLWLAIRARSFYFFSASNPAIENGGFLNESKKDIHQILPPGSFPLSLHFPKSTDPAQVFAMMNQLGLSFPVMGKPDVGGRGRGIRLIRDLSSLTDYVSKTTMDFHVQALVPYPEEIGIFYHRIPGERKGNITGIVRKDFLSVTGNGRDSVETLLQRDQRGLVYLQSLKQLADAALHDIPQDGERRIVSPFGNHARGALFLDDTHRADERLLAVIDRLVDQIPGFHYGRFDLRYQNWESLLEGRDFALIELNGAWAEPTHMYDPRHSLFFAWKEIIRHWNVLHRISRINHARGVPYLSWKEGRAMFRKDKELSAALNAMPQ